MWRKGRIEAGEVGCVARAGLGLRLCIEIVRRGNGWRSAKEGRANKSKFSVNCDKRVAFVIA